MSILEKINREHVFNTSLNPTKDSFSIIEGCDYYYSINLNKQEVKELIEELIVVYEDMK